MSLSDNQKRMAAATCTAFYPKHQASIQVLLEAACAMDAASKRADSFPGNASFCRDAAEGYRAAALVLTKDQAPRAVLASDHFNLASTDSATSIHP